MLISLILLFLTAASVSAADENMTDVLTFEEDLNIESSDDVDNGDFFPTFSEDDYMVCRVPDFEPIPLDPSNIIPIKGTLADLDRTIQCRDNNSVIQLTRNYTYDEVVDFELKDGIVITKNLTIDGQGYAIDTGNLTTIFKIDGGNLTLINIIFPNADIRYCYHNDVLVSVINYNAFPMKWVVIQHLMTLWSV